MDDGVGASAQAPFVVRVTVQWGDCDPAGVVFFPRYFAWMDVAAHGLANEMGVRRGEMPPSGRHGFPIVHAEANFAAMGYPGDDLEVRTWVGAIGRTSFELRHHVVRIADDTQLAYGIIRRVHVERDANDAMHSSPLTDAMRAVLGRYLAATK